MTTSAAGRRYARFGPAKFPALYRSNSDLASKRVRCGQALDERPSPSRLGQARRVTVGGEHGAARVQARGGEQLEGMGGSPVASRVGVRTDHDAVGAGAQRTGAVSSADVKAVPRGATPVISPPLAKSTANASSGPSTSTARPPR
jgi:hypothetical protein